MLEAVVPVRLVEGHRKQGVASKGQTFFAGGAAAGIGCSVRSVTRRFPL
jgi:hypothetical protein